MPLILVLTLFSLVNTSHATSLEGCAQQLEVSSWDARQAVIEAFMTWNQLTPQGPGQAAIMTAMAAQILKNAPQILGVHIQLTDAEVDQIGENLNRAHEAFHIPVRFSRDRLSGHPANFQIVEPERIRGIFSRFYEHASMEIVSGIFHYLSADPNSAHAGEWYVLEFTGARSKTAGFDFLNRKILEHESLEQMLSAHQIRLLAEAGRALEQVLDSTSVRQEAKAYREQIRENRKVPAFASAIPSLDLKIDKDLRHSLRENSGILLSGFGLDL